MSGSVRDYAILYLGARKAGTAVIGGGNVLTSTPQHKLDGIEHVTADDLTRLNATTAYHGLLPKLAGGTTDFLRADGTWAEPPGTGAGAITLSAATLVQTASDADNATTTTPVLGVAPTVGNLLIAAVVSTGNTITSLAQTNVAWTELVAANNGTALKIALWKGVVSASAGTTLTVTGTAFLGCRLWEFSNLTGTLVQSASVTDGTSTSGSVTPHIVPASGNMIFALAGFDTGGTLLRPFGAKDGNVSNFVGAGYAYANPYGHSVGWVPSPASVWASIIAEVS